MATNQVNKTGAGHLIVVAVQTNQNAVTSVTDDAGNTYVPVPQGRAVNTSVKIGVELWYAKSSKAGAVKVTANAPTVYATVVWEVANVSTTSPFDAGGHARQPGLGRRRRPAPRSRRARPASSPSPSRSPRT